ncbi:hypothetical protein KEM56_003257 [Ascosphaera pollenicola]|nr:hypothetical protein KEM56_003257 [Ascosphaera pollenicola]
MAPHYPSEAKVPCAVCGILVTRKDLPAHRQSRLCKSLQADLASGNKMRFVLGVEESTRQKFEPGQSPPVESRIQCECECAALRERVEVLEWQQALEKEKVAMLQQQQTSERQRIEILEQQQTLDRERVEMLEQRLQTLEKSMQQGQRQETAKRSPSVIEISDDESHRVKKRKRMAVKIATNGRDFDHYELSCIINTAEQQNKRLRKDPMTIDLNSSMA